MGKDLKTGEVAAIEIGNQIPGQMSVADVPGVIPSQETFDPDTGEILEEPAPNKVVDMRKKA